MFKKLEWILLNITVGHYNAHTDHLKQLLDYSKDQNYINTSECSGPSWHVAKS